MIEGLKEKIIHYITYDFNINLYGGIGCGKTTLIKDVFKEMEEESKKPYLYLKFSDFINMRILYSKFIHFLETEILLKKLDKLNIVKFSHLYELIQKRKNDGKLETKFYIVIDDINEIQCINIIKKQFNKIFTLCNDFDINLILISTFNLAKSELALFCDFSTFLAIDFPLRNPDEIKMIIKEKFPEYHKEIDNNFMLGLLNINFYTSNLNELIYFFGEFLETIKTEKPEQNTQDGQTEYKMYKGKAFEKSSISNSMRDKIQNLCHNSIIHLKENYNKVDNNAYSIDLLTDNLSFSQKLILLSAFLAGETNPRYDSKIFKNAKNIKTRIYKKAVKSLKAKNVNSFTINRLLAVFASLYELREGKNKCFECVDIELIADINNLIQNNLLKFITNTTKEANLFARKIITTISFEFAEKLAEEFGIRIDEFISPDN